jgi:phosphohistidine phosphatase
MKTLYLQRHAKAEPDDSGAADHQRALTPQGLAAAAAMGRHLLERGELPELILCSTARRARETADQLMAALAPAPRLVHRDDLYLSGLPAHFRILGELPDSLRRVMVVGHNPDLERLTRLLAAYGAARIGDSFPTAGCAVLTLDGRSWPGLERGCAVLRNFFRPRDLASGPGVGILSAHT